MRFWGLLLVLLPLLTAPQAIDAQQKDKARNKRARMPMLTLRRRKRRYLVTNIIMARTARAYIE